jgi:hypothetical protein
MGDASAVLRQANHRKYVRVNVKLGPAMLLAAGVSATAQAISSEPRL